MVAAKNQLLEFLNPLETHCNWKALQSKICSFNKLDFPLNSQLCFVITKAQWPKQTCANYFKTENRKLTDPN